MQSCCILFELSQWFKNKEQAMAGSVAIIFVRFGAVLPEIFGPSIYSLFSDTSTGLSYALSVGIVL
jgi:hypothetical protein